MGDLRELIERLEHEGASYGLDVAIAQALVPEIIVGRQRDDDSGADPHTYRCFTTKIDDVIWLLGVLLPDAFYGVERTGLHPGMVPGSSDKAFRAEAGDWGTPCRAYADTPVIALLLSTLRALQESQGGDG